MVGEVDFVIQAAAKTFVSPIPNKNRPSVAARILVYLNGQCVDWMEFAATIVFTVQPEQSHYHCEGILICVRGMNVFGQGWQIEWINQANVPKVPMSVAATGPKVVQLAARTADGITFSVGANPERLKASIDLAKQTRARD